MNKITITEKEFLDKIKKAQLFDELSKQLLNNKKDFCTINMELKGSKEYLEAFVKHSIKHFFKKEISKLKSNSIE